MKKNILLMLCMLTYLVTAWSQDELKWKAEIDKLDHVIHQHSESAKGLIVLTGSSSARLWKSAPSAFPDYNLINNGFGGSQMFEMLYFLDKLVINHAPDKILIYEGDNDINAGKSAEEIMVTTKKVVSKIKKALPETSIYFISPKPSLSRWSLAEKYIDLNKKLEAYCAETDHVTYIDVWTPMLREDGTPIKDIFIEDGLHMNEKGYDIWKAAIGLVVNK